MSTPVVSGDNNEDGHVSDGGGQRETRLEETEDDEVGLKAAYSMSDMLDALTDEEEDIFVEAETGEEGNKSKETNLEEKEVESTIKASVSNTNENNDNVEDPTADSVIEESNERTVSEKIEMEGQNLPSSSDDQSVTTIKQSSHSPETDSGTQTLVHMKKEIIDEESGIDRVILPTSNGKKRSINETSKSKTDNGLGGSSVEANGNISVVSNVNVINKNLDCKNEFSNADIDELGNNIPLPEEVNPLEQTFSEDIDRVNQVKVSCDISGRFFVEDSSYQNTQDINAENPSAVSSEKMTSSKSGTLGEPKYENIYDEVVDGAIPGSRFEGSTGELNRLSVSVSHGIDDSCAVPLNKANLTNPTTCTSVSLPGVNVVTFSKCCMPSIADRIAVLTAFTNLDRNNINTATFISGCNSVSLPSVSSAGCSISDPKSYNFNIDSRDVSLNVSAMKQDRLLQRAKSSSDNTLTFEDSISTSSFKTQPIAGDDPFGNLKANRNTMTFKTTHIGSEKTESKLTGENNIIDLTINKQKLTEKSEMVDNDIYGDEDSDDKHAYPKLHTIHDPWKPLKTLFPQPKSPYQHLWETTSKPTKEDVKKGDNANDLEMWTELYPNEDEVYESFDLQQADLNQQDLMNINKTKLEETSLENSDEGSNLSNPWRSKMVLEITEEKGKIPPASPLKKKQGVYGKLMQLATGNSLKNTAIYENVNYVNQGSYGGNAESLEYVDDYEEDDGWSSSEFESYENTPVGTLEATDEANANGATGGGGALEDSIRRKKPKGHHHKHGHGIRTSFKSPRSSDIQQMITRLGDRLGDKIELFGQRLSKQEYEDGGEEEPPLLMEIPLNMEKHPPAKLPVMPGGLNALQVKRRHILSSLVESEKNYLESLKRIVNDYEKPLQEAKPHILAKQSIKVIFHKVRDILQCHNMFHIELSEAVKQWDEEEKIGNAFIASFSKSMVFETYSAYVNNFSVAMEATKKQARSRPAFSEFLKQNLESSSDKLSLFGLMVKPVQRFPQFIMLMQDLLKQTPHDHHDRIPLQMALTELENLTQKLNETKRESESRYDAKRIVSSLVGNIRNPIKSDDKRYLVRQDNVLCADIVNGESKTKRRRIYLMSDLVLCVSVDGKESSSEKYKHKWHISVMDAEVCDHSIIPSYQVKSVQGRTSITPIKAAHNKAVDLISHIPLRRSLRKSERVEREKPEDKRNIVATNPNNPYKEEVDDMLHDLPIVEQIGQLIIQLRMKYEGLNTSVINGLMRSLQVNIQQKSDVDKCIVHLSVPTSKGQEVRRYAFQLDTANLRRDWLFELQNTKLSHESTNRPGWLIPENERMFNAKMPLFMRPLFIDITQHETRTPKKKKFKFKVECAVPVPLPSPELPGVGIQHLWVCSGDRGRGHVTIVSFHGNQPQVVESFKSSDSPILCAELVPGYACCDDKRAFAQNTVWMALENQSLLVRSVSEEHREEPELSLQLDSTVTCMKYLDSKLYIGLNSGTLIVYSRDQDGIWQTDKKDMVVLDKDQAVTDLLAVDHKMWVACGKAVWVLNVVSHYMSNGSVKTEVNKTTHSVSHAGETFVQSIIKAGAGLVVSFRASSLLRLYHLETMYHLQDINVASVLSELMDAKKKLDSNMRESFRRIHITYLMACKGLLWIGTSVGCVLTLPLPRLEGVPQIKGRPFVSYQGHVGPVKFLSSIYCGASQLNKPEIEDNSVSDIYPQSEVSCDDGLGTSGVYSTPHGEVSGGVMSLTGVTETETDEYKSFTQSDEIPPIRRAVDDFGLLGGPDSGTLGGLAGSKNFWASTPDLRLSQVKSSTEDIHSLYGSLLRFPQEDYDAEILGMKHGKGRLHNIPGLNLVKKKTNAVNARISEMINKQLANTPQSKYATLPVLREDLVPPPTYSSSCETSDSNRTSVIVDDESTTSSTSEVDNFLSMQSASHDSANVIGAGGGSSGSNTSLQQPATPPPMSLPQASGTTAIITDAKQKLQSKDINLQKQFEHHQNNKKLFISQSAPVAMLNNSVLGKSHMVISGGEGHINWTDAKAVDLKCEDICLLLWKYRQ